MAKCKQCYKVFNAANKQENICKKCRKKEQK